MARVDERLNDQIRNVHIETNYLIHPEGSALISIGKTKVICTATVEERVPPFMRGQGKGWVNAEYSMLPRATEQRNVREAAKGKLTGRTMEIQRLIGRALRSVVALDELGERTLWIDCDVIQADGGTRTAAITGGYVAMALALEKLVKMNVLETLPLYDFLAAISVGVVPELGAIVDLCYLEDASAHVDMNVVMTGAGDFVELQGTGEEATYTKAQLMTMLSLAEKGIEQLIDKQKQALSTELTATILARQSKQDD